MTTGSQVKSSSQIRQEFLDFFEEKGHAIVPSASIVPFGDATLMFTNAGMNQFKDVFLGTGSRSYVRAADTQKCLRVSGKHNDLEEVGHDTYHHTFFEMLGNWSFGDYFKKDAIRWAWELLVDRWGLDPQRLYATVHEGDDTYGLTPDEEAEALWKSETSIPPEHILRCPSKDNFWMMGDTGPCGPCSEIHVDLRSDEERAAIPGATLVNADDPRVIEIWNLVFIQYNALGNNKLESLAAKHVDTGMGFERISAVMQGKDSTYDTDLFAGILQKTADMCPDERVRGYDDIVDMSDEEREKIRIAMRVIADHVRTIAIAIGDSVTLSNNGRGYVIRRILRRAVRYGFKFLGLEKPFLFELTELVREKMGDVFQELERYQRSISKITEAEEKSFFSTLATGVKDFEGLVPHVHALHSAGDDNADAIAALKADVGTMDLLRKAFGKDTDLDDAIAQFTDAAKQGLISGDVVFLLHDTYGFPMDLTNVMAVEEKLKIDEKRYEARMEIQKEMGRQAASFKVDHNEKNVWEHATEGDDSHFLGYEQARVTEAKVCGVRTLEVKKEVKGKKGKKGKEKIETHYQLLLDQTPFYAESGGQLGDTGVLQIGDETIRVLDTRKEEGHIVHIVDALPKVLDAPVIAQVDEARRNRIIKHHTATHLLQAALREVLGPHINQQGSLVAPDRLRFDFSHFERISTEELRDIEARINEVIQRNIPKEEERDVPIEEAMNRGARALFGEKYGENVRIITFDPAYSMELCGGIHCEATGEIGLFRFLSEGAIASGSRRVEAVVGQDAISHVQRELASLDLVRSQIKGTERKIEEEIAALVEQSKLMERELAKLKQAALEGQVEGFVEEALQIGPAKLVCGRLDGVESNDLKDLAQRLRDRLTTQTVLVLGSSLPADGKVYLAAFVSDDLIASHDLKAGAIVGQLAKIVGGGGGGRPTLATAGGRQPEKLDEALAQAQSILQSTLA